MEYQYDMTNIWGDYVTIKVFSDGRASVTFELFDITASSPYQTIGFDSEDDAYNWAYKNGYRE